MKYNLQKLGKLINSIHDYIFYRRRIKIQLIQTIKLHMDIQRTNSLYVDNAHEDMKNQSEDKAKENVTFSEHAMSLTFQNRTRLPNFMMQTLRAKGSQSSRKQPAEENMKQSKLGGIIKSKIKEFRNMYNCQICESEMKKSDKQLSMCDCEHKFNFCESCLHHYVIYKVKTFEEVRCPREQCNALLDMNGQFFKQLPADIQKNYRKLHQFYITANDPTVKLCPRQNCEGLIKATIHNFMLCNICGGQFCSKCLLEKHQGECDSHQVMFFENNLHYRQCKKCKFVIQKNQGCNHMTCRCGFQFCYVCGANWQQAHYGNHDENGNLIVQAAVGGMDAPVVAHQNEACCDCGCCDEACGPLACIFKFPLKLLVFVLFFLVMIIIWIGRDLLVIGGMSLICIFAGLFGFSFQLLSELDGCCCIIGALFFPFLMIAGVGVAFKQIFCDVASDLCGEYWNIFCQGASSIYQI